MAHEQEGRICRSFHCFWAIFFLNCPEGNLFLITGTFCQCFKFGDGTIKRIFCLDFRRIGLRIKTLRGDMGQREFAKLLNVHQTYISEIELAKRKPSLKVLHSITTHFDVTFDYILVGGKTQKQKTKVD